MGHNEKRAARQLRRLRASQLARPWHMALAHAFTGSDTTVLALWPDEMFELSEVTNCSTSTFADVFDVRRLGHSLPVAWAVGAITIGGTLVCHRGVNGGLWQLRNHFGLVRAASTIAGGREADLASLATQAQAAGASVLAEQLPEVHLLFLSESENGLVAIERLYGVKFVSGGGAIGQDNPLEEQAFQFKARFYEHLRLHRHFDRDEVALFLQNIQDPHANIRASYWNRHFDTPTLLQGVQKLSEQTGSYDLLEYIEQETLRYDQGESFSAALADRGQVLIQMPGQTSYGPATESQDSVDEVGATVAVAEDTPLLGVTAEVVIDENVPVASGIIYSGGIKLKVDDGKIYLAPKEGEYPDRPESQMSGTTHTVRLRGTEYYDLCSPARSSYSWAPTQVSLVVEEVAGGAISVRREMKWEHDLVAIMENAELGGEYNVSYGNGTSLAVQCSYSPTNCVVYYTHSALPDKEWREGFDVIGATAVNRNIKLPGRLEGKPGEARFTNQQKNNFLEIRWAEWLERGPRGLLDELTNTYTHKALLTNGQEVHVRKNLEEFDEDAIERATVQLIDEDEEVVAEHELTRTSETISAEDREYRVYKYQDANYTFRIGFTSGFAISPRLYYHLPAGTAVKDDCEVTAKSPGIELMSTGGDWVGNMKGHAVSIGNGDTCALGESVDVKLTEEDGQVKLSFSAADTTFRSDDAPTPEPEPEPEGPVV